MNILLLQQQINEYIAANSRFEPHRAYLGMSKIGDCPRRVTRELLHGTIPTDEIHRMSYTGYDQEASILKMLVEARIALPYKRELVSQFDERLRGHIDAVTVENDLLEIKSLSSLKFQRVDQTRRIHPRHYVQVQLYMRYGGYRQALVVCRNRDTYEHLLFRIAYDPAQAENYEQKAKRILAAWDEKLILPCECGHCKRP